jgi:hypothetical protein
MSSELVTRRAVTRGVAWTVPLVAVGVAAPAFAASPGGSISAGTVAPSCRCIGNGDFYHLNISFTNTSSTAFTINGTSLTSSSNGTTTYVGTQPQVVPAFSTVILTFRFKRSSNPAKVQITFKYTVTNNTTLLTSAEQIINIVEMEFPNCAANVCP